MFIKTDGLIIKESSYSEKDKIVSILTSEYGVIRAFAKGCKNSKHKNFSAIQLLSYSDFVIFNKNETYTIDEASLKASFFKIRADFKALLIAQYFCEIILNLVKENMESKKILTLALNSIYALTKEKFNKKIVKSVFEVKILSLSGYEPDLSECKICKIKNPVNPYFSFCEPGLVCANCIKNLSLNKNNYAKLNFSLILALKHSLYSSNNAMFSFTLNKENTEELANITQKLILNYINKPLKTLQIYSGYE